jgi:tRNA(Ile2) C34 agmatinyltransferase TiaS
MEMDSPAPADGDATYDVVCPHCGKTFESELLSGPSDRHQGFKCPHCRLFVSYARADEQDLVEPS